MITTCKTYLYVVIFLLGLSTIATAQNDADPAITSFGFADASVPVGGTTTLSLFFLNNGTFQDLAPGSIAIAVSLTNAGEYAAEPESELAVVSGHAADMFNWTYNVSTKTLRGVLNTAVPPGDGGQIDINVIGVAVGSNTSVVNTQRLQPADLQGDNVANNTLPPAELTVEPSLPVTLVRFQATKESQMANLSWTATEETNASHFEVQRSTDAKTWNPIGRKAATGESKSTVNYSFVDSAPLRGTSYYRLKMIDNDETFSYSRIVNVTFAATFEAVYIYPNPNKGMINVGGMVVSKIALIELIDMSSKIVYKQRKPVSSNGFRVDNVIPGTYLVRITETGGAVHSHKINIGR